MALKCAIRVESDKSENKVQFGEREIYYGDNGRKKNITGIQIKGKYREWEKVAERVPVSFQY